MTGGAPFEFNYRLDPIKPILHPLLPVLPFTPTPSLRARLKVKHNSGLFPFDLQERIALTAHYHGSGPN